MSQILPNLDISWILFVTSQKFGRNMDWDLFLRMMFCIMRVTPNMILLTGEDKYGNVFIFVIYDCKLRFYIISIMNNWQININFLTVRALEYYSKEIGPHSEKANQIFHELRGNIVNNVFEQYKKTGFIWENYNQDTGKFLKNCYRYKGSALTLTFPKWKCH